MGGGGPLDIRSGEYGGGMDMDLIQIPLVNF